MVEKAHLLAGKTCRPKCGPPEPPVGGCVQTPMYLKIPPSHTNSSLWVIPQCKHSKRCNQVVTKTGRNVFAEAVEVAEMHAKDFGFEAAVGGGTDTPI